MLALFTQLLQDYLVRQNVAPAGRVSLGPPDRAFVGALPQGQSVNIYLADIRENRKLRSNERRRDPAPPNGHLRTVGESLYPAWVDAHYIITAWDTSNDQSIRALKEHEVLAAVSSALLAGDPFTPREVYPDPTDLQLASVETERARARADATANGRSQEEIVKAGDAAADLERKRIADRVLAPLNAWPDEFRLPGLPYQVLHPDGFPKLSEFWTTMGVGSIWKPIVYLVAAVPVELKPRFDYPLVTTMKTSTGQTSNAPGQKLIGPLDEDGYRSGTIQEWYQIGGFVSKQVKDRDGNLQFDADHKRILEPVKRAKVILQTAGNAAAVPPVPSLQLQETRTDDNGRYQFIFTGPLSGDQNRFQVVAQSAGLKADPVDVVLSPAEPFPHDVEMLYV